MNMMDFEEILNRIPRPKKLFVASPPHYGAADFPGATGQHVADVAASRAGGTGQHVARGAGPRWGRVVDAWGVSNIAKMWGGGGCDIRTRTGHE